MGLVGPMMDTRAQVAIVGAGASGTLLATHLLHRPGDASVALIERGETYGLGVAYSTIEPCHLLNVPVWGMSALHDRPNHFLEWLHAEGIEAAGGDFVPRATYGRYLRSVLATAEHDASGRLRRVRGAVTGLRREAAGLVVEVDGQLTLRADRVVLALGNAAPAALPFLPDGYRSLRNPWDGRVAEIPPGDPVLLVGTGLTAVDVALSLQTRGHRGPIRMLSRHGLLPQAHRPPADAPRPLRTLPALPAPLTAGRLLRWARAEVRAAQAEGDDWRDVMHVLRQAAQDLWRALPQAERRRFLVTLSRHWGVHRHRMAPQVGAAIDDLLGSGQLEIVAGRIRACREQERGFAVDVDVRASGSRTIETAWIVNCTGPDPDPARSDDPLLRSLLRDGLARRDPLGLGLDCRPDGALLDATGVATEELWAIGPPRLGSLWETTAVPEIRVQAAELAERLSARSAQGVEVPASG